jgi:DnaJ-class molecular chaperone
MPTRCLYEILEVDKDADDDVLKRAYRKQALVWHPGGCACPRFGARRCRICTCSPLNP